MYKCILLKLNKLGFFLICQMAFRKWYWYFWLPLVTLIRCVYNKYNCKIHEKSLIDLILFATFSFKCCCILKTTRRWTKTNITKQLSLHISNLTLLHKFDASENILVNLWKLVPQIYYQWQTSFLNLCNLNFKRLML